MTIVKIGVIGTGYVGLVTGVCLAEAGNNVICVDIVEEKIKKLNEGELPIYEPDLEVIYKRGVKEKRLSFTTNLKLGVEQSQVIFLALPTPPNGDGAADLSYILAVADKLGPLLKQYTVIVDKSTVPVGTSEKVKKAIKRKSKVSFDVVSNPEFLREGLAVADFMKPDRIVVGTRSERARNVMSELYAPFVRQGNPIIFMDERSAEMTKYAANAFLAMKISFMNEIANLSERAGANVDDIRLGIGADERIGKRFLFPGIGYGGSCFPKDVLALESTAKEYSYDFKIIKAVTKVNEIQKTVLFDKIKDYYKNDLNRKTFGLWGLAFKPDTDDIREAPSIEIINSLLSAGAKIKAYDPEAANNIRKIYEAEKNLSIVLEPYDALVDTDALIIATEWSEFRSADFKKLRELKTKVIFDGRNLYDLNEMEKHGFYYESIGRKTVNGKK